MRPCTRVAACSGGDAGGAFPGGASDPASALAIVEAMRSLAAAFAPVAAEAASPTCVEREVITSVGATPLAKSAASVAVGSVGEPAFAAFSRASSWLVKASPKRSLPALSPPERSDKSNASRATAPRVAIVPLPRIGVVISFTPFR